VADTACDDTAAGDNLPAFIFTGDCRWCGATVLFGTAGFREPFGAVMLPGFPLRSARALPGAADDDVAFLVAAEARGADVVPVVPVFNRATPVTATGLLLTTTEEVLTVLVL
jgi:hypothetical protein